MQRAILKNKNFVTPFWSLIRNGGVIRKLYNNGAASKYSAKH